MKRSRLRARSEAGVALQLRRAVGRLVVGGAQVVIYGGRLRLPLEGGRAFRPWLAPSYVTHKHRKQRLNYWESAVHSPAEPLRRANERRVFITRLDREGLGWDCDAEWKHKTWPTLAPRGLNSQLYLNSSKPCAGFVMKSGNPKIVKNIHQVSNKWRNARTCGWHARLWLRSLSHLPRLCHVI